VATNYFLLILKEQGPGQR